MSVVCGWLSYLIILEMRFHVNACSLLHSVLFSELGYFPAFIQESFNAVLQTVPSVHAFRKQD